ncbi:MAG TPA: HEAT repeat domain-containing protein, partial [Blastocatellia bacterium]|nr:HEAT repeat domain-containing protein [Blastocatellia bacterium]
MKFAFRIILLTLHLGAGVFGQQALPSNQTLQERLFERVTKGDEEQRFDTVMQLVGLFNSAPKTATEQGIALLKSTLQRDSSPQVRALAAQAFENCCGDQSVSVLLASLGSEREASVRKAIIYALAHHPSPQVTSSLTLLLNDKAQEIRGAAAFALAEITDPASQPALMEVLRKRQKDEDAFTRAQSLRALGKIGNRSAIDIFV